MYWLDYFTDNDEQHEREEMFQAFKGRLAVGDQDDQMIFDREQLNIERAERAKEEAEWVEDPLDKHVRKEGFREAHWKKMGWPNFRPRPFTG